MAIEYFPRLSHNFSQLLDDAEDYDVIIRVGKNSNIKEFHAHSVILKSRSPYFKRALSQNLITKKDNVINFNKPNISPITFGMIIRYLYAGKLDLNEKTGADILDLILISDELLLDELVTSVQEYLIKDQTKWLQQNFVKVFHTVFKLESCKQLQNYCLETICDDPVPFFESPTFPTLDKSILLGLVKREDLQIDEIKLWNYLVKWGIAQTSELKGKSMNNLRNWSEKDFMALKSTLNQFIAHIRFFDISTKDFHKNIWPFRKVLPEALFEDIVSFIMVNTIPKQYTLASRHGNITVNSLIIKPKHASILVNWIQRKNSNTRITKDSKYNFKLIHRGSRDGYDINTIRRRCVRKGACIVIIKSKENDTIIGGYNPLGWRYCDPQLPYYIIKYYWSITTESFIFSLGDGKDLNNVKISRVVNSDNAIYEACHENNPLNFGNSDLVINNNAGTCKQAHYECSILDTNNFTIEEMEIFKVHKG